MSKFKPYIATPERLLADGYNAEEVQHALDVIAGNIPMPKANALTDSLYALLYRMGREEVAANRAYNEQKSRQRNAPSRHQPRNESLRRARAKRLNAQERKAILRLLISVVADTQAFALLAAGDEEGLLKYLDLKPK